MAWPVKVSSTMALSTPVLRHCAMNRGRARAAILRMHEHRHRHGGEGHHRQQRRDGEHHDGDADQQQDGVEHLAERLLEALGDVVDVVGDPAEQVAPRRCWSM